MTESDSVDMRDMKLVQMTEPNLAELLDFQLGQMKVLHSADPRDCHWVQLWTVHKL